MSGRVSRAMTLASSIGLLALIGGCQAQTSGVQAKPVPPNAPVAGAADPTAAAQRVDALIGTARCERSSQCRSIARGSKACGGPTSYAAWSTVTTDAKALETAVDDERRLVQAANERSGMASNCMLLADPGARCEAQRCVSGQGVGSLPR